MSTQDDGQARAADAATTSGEHGSRGATPYDASGVPRGGTLYGAGGAPLGSRQRPRPDRLMLAAAAVGALGLLIGVVFATGLTPFGPERGAASVATFTPAGSASPAAVEPTRAPAPPTPTEAAKTTAPASVGPRIGTLRSAGSSLCLEVIVQGQVDAAPVHQVPCAGAAAQLWRLDRDDDVVTVVNTATGGCLDVAGASRDNQAPVQQWSCQPVPQQRWRISPIGSGFALVSEVSGKCLDVPAGSADAGVRVQQFDCNGTGAQQWVFAG